MEETTMKSNSLKTFINFSKFTNAETFKVEFAIENPIGRPPFKKGIHSENFLFCQIEVVTDAIV